MIKTLTNQPLFTRSTEIRFGIKPFVTGLWCNQLTIAGKNLAKGVDAYHVPDASTRTVNKSSVWRQKGLTGYCFKYIDRSFRLRTDET